MSFLYPGPDVLAPQIHGSSGNGHEEIPCKAALRGISVSPVQSVLKTIGCLTAQTVSSVYNHMERNEYRWIRH